MSKSVLIKVITPLNNKMELKTLLKEFNIRENGENEFLLSFNQKWIWLFFEVLNENVYDLQFSHDFTKDERVLFLEVLKNKIDYLIVDSD